MSQSNVMAVDLTTPAAADTFVKGLSDAAKRAVLSSLLRAGVRADDTPPATPADWRTMKVVPPVLSPEGLARIRRADETPDDTFDPVKYLEQLDREDPD